MEAIKTRRLIGRTEIAWRLLTRLQRGKPDTAGNQALGCRSGTPWREIGYQRPRNCLGSLAIGVIFGVSFKLLLKAVVMPMCAHAAFDLTALGIIYWNLEIRVAHLLFKG